MKLFTKKDWQCSMTVALFQSRGTVLPTNGNRWMLWVILPMGMILAIRASRWCACDTLYRRLFTSGWGQKGVNHSMYAKCSGGWLFIGNKSRCAAGLMLKTAWTCAMRWADGLSAVGRCTERHEITLNPSNTLLSTVNQNRVKSASNSFWWCIATVADNVQGLDVYYVSYWFVVPVGTGLQEFDAMIHGDRGKG